MLQTVLWFKDKRILVAEDDYFVALETRLMLEKHGASVVGPAPSVLQTMAFINEYRLDAALLDLELQDGTSLQAADLLQDLGVPFCFVSGAPSGAVPYLYRPYALAKPAIIEAIGRTLFQVGPRQVQ